MVQTTALKKPSAAKGAPPKRGQGVDPIKADTRKNDLPNKQLHLKIPPHIFDEFSRIAGEECGFSKGGKSEFFLQMFADWKRQHRK